MFGSSSFRHKAPCYNQHNLIRKYDGFEWLSKQGKNSKEHNVDGMRDIKKNF